LVTVQLVLALRRYTFRKFCHTNCYNEAHALRLARHPTANSLIRNLRTKSNTC